MQWRRAMSKIIPTIRTGKDTTADDMNVGMTIDERDMKEEVDSSGIAIYELVDPHNASSAIKKGTDVQTVHTKIELTLNSVCIAG